MIPQNSKKSTKILIIISGLLFAVVVQTIYQFIYTDSSRIPSAFMKELTSSDDKSVQFYSIRRFKKLKGIALVIHGLNLKPEKMEPIITLFNQSGIDVLNLSLHGHGRNYVSRNHNNPRLCG
jgi:hypothetical protein